MVKGTKADTVIKILSKIPLKQRRKVKEVTLDMAGNMGLIVKKPINISHYEASAICDGPLTSYNFLKIIVNEIINSDMLHILFVCLSKEI